MCFTSPPYFDTEKYSEEPTQSYIKFPKENDWISGFLIKTIKNCHYGLKNEGYLALNIAKTFEGLSSDFVSVPAPTVQSLLLPD